MTEIDARAALEGIVDRVAKWHDERPPHERVRDVFIDIGEIEAGIADSSSPECESAAPIERAARDVSMAGARLLHASWQSQKISAQLVQALCHAVSSLTRMNVPDRVRVSAPEGYVYYALYPEAFLRTAASLATEWTARDQIAVVGLRSIGTGLSAAVSAAFEAAGMAVRSWTVRPHGHAFDRELRLAPHIRTEWRSVRGRWVLVDEGPGLSGSTLACVARTLAQIGVRDQDVILMPAHAPAIDRFAPHAAGEWRRHRIVVAEEKTSEVDSVVLGRIDLRGRVLDLSGGAWRDRVFRTTDEYPPVHPWHERRKWLTHDQHLLKFVGLGRRGYDALLRASDIADAGWTPAPSASGNGVIDLPWIAGRPPDPTALTTGHIDQLARYLAWTSTRTLDRSGISESIQRMTVGNVTDALGSEFGDIAATALERERFLLEQQSACWLDARMFPHEWRITDVALLKVDGYEHGDDHFFPGPSDIAWDLAGTMVEFQLHPDGRDRLLAAYQNATGDRHIRRRVRVYELMYLAFRLGYATLATETLRGRDDDDADRFDVARTRYLSRLRRAITAVASGTSNVNCRESIV